MNLYSDGQQWCSLFVSLTDKGGEGREYKYSSIKKIKKMRKPNNKFKACELFVRTISLWKKFTVQIWGFFHMTNTK